VNSFIQAAECSEAVGKVINIGTGKEISIGYLANTILDLLGKDIPIRTEDQRVRPSGSEVERLCADNSLSKQLLGWEPRYTLRQGLTETIEWIKTNLAQYKPDRYSV
jgi:nucleoside-diphosphate-sugar epimerase